MVKNAPGHDPKNEHSIDICFSPFWFSPWNYIALAGLEVMLGHTWFQHGQLESAWSRGHELLNKLQFVCLLKQVTFFYSNCHWKILINIDFFLYLEKMFTWCYSKVVCISIFPWHYPKIDSRHPIHMFLRAYWLCLENCWALAGLEV